jgi:ABC-2 type transport system permease protein
MKAARIGAVTRKEFLHIVRDPRSLGMGIAIPMLLLVIYGYALTMDVDEVPLVVWDQSETPQSRELVSGFLGSRYFAGRGHVSSYPELERTIDSRQAMAALVIPADFARQIDAGRPVAVQMIVDGSDSNTATIAMGYAAVVAETYSQAVRMQQIRKILARPPDPPLELRPRVWFNEELESRNYIVPGLIAVLMMMIAALLTSLTVAREWERGTMEQLISTPVKGPELILGKLLPYLAIGLLDTVIAVVMGRFVFDVPLRGSVALLFAVATVFLAGGLSLGILVSIVTRNQLMASQLAALLTLLPSVLLSGFVFEILSMPEPIRLFTYVIPARYFLDVLRGIYLKGIGLEILAGEVLLLILFSGTMLLLATRRFRKKLV